MESLKMIKSFEQFTKVDEGFFDWLTGKEEQGAPKTSTGGPDVVDSVITEFYATLQDFVDSGRSVPVQLGGRIEYSKMVENIQAALAFLGYKFPKYGVDGKFGPETAAAIQAFNDDTKKAENSND